MPSEKVQTSETVPPPRPDFGTTETGEETSGKEDAGDQAGKGTSSRCPLDGSQAGR
jgi:hypothetical protein